ncbi:internal scaffolding protein [Sigmofec virus UA08Rod_5228]|uniref:Internal scaffolding protein n=1 Tax=Sigmofec virus UA08Rod_5228 TaxID=2929416 RepID=A0A976N193_9VIRU|nr:internal scaffolding protein [Sigmofec virus UA08Rod_5228]
MEFEKFNWRERKQQSFDKENIVFEKMGKKINIYDFIQEGREDTEIYPTLEKYGCIDKMMLNREDVYADYTELQKMRDYRGVKDFEIQAKNMFYNLPLEVRKEFDNDINKFTRGADEYIGKMKAEDAAKAAELKKQQELTVEKPVQGDLING